MNFRNASQQMIPMLILCGVLTGVAGCASNPYTNRWQFLLIPESQEVHMGNKAYAQALNDPKLVVSQNPAEVEPVKRVAERIIAAAKQSKYAERAKSFDWDVTVIKDDKTKMPGPFPEAKSPSTRAFSPRLRTKTDWRPSWDMKSFMPWLDMVPNESANTRQPTSACNSLLSRWISSH